MVIRVHKTGLRLGFAASALVSSLCISSLSQASPLAIGTIEKIDPKNASVITVLGQKYSIASAKLVAGNKNLPAAQGVRFLVPGAVVWVDGELKADGSTQVASLTVLPDANVPGATQLFVSGVVSAIDLTGKAKIGDLIVDLTPTYGSGAESIRVGDVVEVIGIQPASNGALVAGTVTSKSGVGGTGRSGVGGTGKLVTEAGVGGTGRSGVGGTGKLVTEAGVGGTGRSGVGGTGKLVTEAGVGGTGRSR
jgi:hypothetical protein